MIRLLAGFVFHPEASAPSGAAPLRSKDQSSVRRQKPGRTSAMRDLPMTRALFAVPLFVMLTGCRTDPPAPKPTVVKDLRPEINRAFRQHNSQTTESLRALSNSYDTGIHADSQKHQLVPRKGTKK